MYIYIYWFILYSGYLSIYILWLYIYIHIYIHSGYIYINIYSGYIIYIYSGYIIYTYLFEETPSDLGYCDYVFGSGILWFLKCRSLSQNSLATAFWIWIYIYMYYILYIELLESAERRLLGCTSKKAPVTSRNLLGRMPKSSSRWTPPGTFRDLPVTSWPGFGSKGPFPHDSRRETQ